MVHPIQSLLLAGVLVCGAGCATATDWAEPGPACQADAAASPAAFESVFRRAAPAVVRVLSVRYRRPGEDGVGHDPFVPLAQGAGEDPTWVAERSAASGFILSADGLVLGSAHAVAGAAETWVELHDGYQLRARVVGVEARLDLALLKVEGRALPVLPVSREDPRPGQWVVAIGAPFGFEQSISAGMVSAFPRELPGVAGVGLIQTDVAINPGSSGGPLLNACGQVIGMSALIFSAQGLYVGVTFAVPARRMLQSAAALSGRGAGRASPGWRTQSLTPALAHAFSAPVDQGAVIVQVAVGGPAAEAGLREGDIVLAVDGAAAGGSDSLDERLSAQPPGRWLPLEVWRDGARRRFDLRLRAASPPEPAQRPLRGGRLRLGLAFARPADAAIAISHGLRVVAAEGAGMLAGIEEGDDITAVNGRRVSTLREFDSALASAQAAGAGTVALLVEREGVGAWIAVRLGEGGSRPR